MNNEAQTSISAYVQSISLKETIRSAKKIETQIVDGLKNSPAVKMLRVDILGVNVLAVKPNPEMEKALETHTREALQQEADQAIYERRNFAVEQERKIKESELNTEIALEEKRKQINEKKMETKLMSSQNDRKLREMKMEADISVEEQKQKFIDVQVENNKKKSDSEAYNLQNTLEPYKNFDWKILMAINNKISAKDNMAMEFRELAENTQKINNLNITPDLLESLIGGEEKTQSKQAFR